MFGIGLPLAEAVPPPPIWGAAITGLAAILLYFVAFGMRLALVAWLRPILNGLAWFFSKIRLDVWRVHIDIGPWIASQIHKLEGTVAHWIGDAANRVEDRAGNLLWATQWLVRQGLTELEMLAGTVEHAFSTLTRVHLPKWLKIAIAAYLPEIVLGPKLLRWIRHHVVPALVHLPQNVLGRLRSVETKVVHLSKIVYRTGAVALPRAVPWVKGEFWRIRRREKALSKRLSKLEKLMVGTAGLAITWAALKRMGLKWLRCGKVKKTGNAVCNMNTDLLTTLLAETALLTTAISVEELARECQAWTTAVEAGTRKLIKEL